MDINKLLKTKEPLTLEHLVTLDAAKGKTTTMTFRALGGTEMKQLIEAHPATAEQVGMLRKAFVTAGVSAKDAPLRAQALAQHNAETFPPALLAAAAVEPAMTLEQADELWNSDVFSLAERTKLFDAVLGLNLLTS